MKDKIETVRNYLGAMKLEKTEDGYYLRYRKSKNRKLMLDDLFKFEDVMEEDGWTRISDFELMITEEAFEEIYKRYMGKLYSRSV